MQINELEDKQRKVNIDVKIIYDKNPSQHMFGKDIKTVIVADVDSQPGSSTALLDLVNGNIDKFKQFDKVKIINGYCKFNRKGQPWLTNVDKIEKI